MARSLFRRTKAQRDNGLARDATCDAPYKHGNCHLIELVNVVKEYDTAAGKFTALKGVSLRVDTHEFVAVVGKSGSGKSTLINMITGIDRPSRGQVFVGDTAVHTLSEGQMAVWRGKHEIILASYYHTVGNPGAEKLHLNFAAQEFPDTEAGKEAIAKLPLPESRPAKERPR